MPRLLFLVNHPRWFLTHRSVIAAQAKAEGFEVHVAAPIIQPWSRLIAERGITCHAVNFKKAVWNPFSELKALWETLRLYAGVRPDVVHHVTMKPVLYGTFAARKLRIPAVVNAFTGGGHIFIGEGALARIARAVLKRVYRFATKHPNKVVIFQNAEDRDALVSRKWISPADAVMLASAADTSHFAPSPTTPSRDVVHVLFAARLIYPKGLADLVEAARILRERSVEFRVLVAGNLDAANPAAIPLKEINRWAHAGLIEYLGDLSDMRAAYAGADIVCLPSYYAEGMPKVLLEAASCGLPTITADMPGCRDSIVDGETGFLVPARDPERLATVLERLIKDDALRLKMGQAGRRLVCERFAAVKMAGATVDLYKRLLA